MKIKTVLILIILAITFLPLSCIVTSHDINVEITCDQFRENHHMINNFQAEIGDKIRVKLCSNPTTGYQWKYEMTDENVLKEEDHDFEEPQGDALGASGMDLWTFEAAEKGTTEVNLEYGQPWEGGAKAEWTYVIKVTVE
ncbi:MAG: protease inhibitor I42 family protein [Dehalococcoidales bacterium]|nr:protease inhibitor I42 family protein [Dehalococcoidales bacterium]